MGFGSVEDYKRRLDKAEEKLDRVPNEGPIWNVDWMDAKDYLSSAIDTIQWVITDKIRDLDSWKALDQETQHKLYYTMCNLGYPHEFRRKTELFRKAFSKYPEFMAIAVPFFDELLPVCDKLATLKSKVMKGRKPSLTPSKIPERTIENTGTCGVCKRNVKMVTRGKHYIWTHGYSVDHHYGRSADCFGSGHQPIEESNEVLTAYQENLEKYLETLPIAIENLTKWLAENPLTKENRTGFENRQRSLSQYKFEIKRIPETIEDLKAEILAWKPRNLPGT
jgi:hypothetical protein